MITQIYMITHIGTLKYTHTQMCVHATRECYATCKTCYFSSSKLTEHWTSHTLLLYNQLQNTHIHAHICKNKQSYTDVWREMKRWMYIDKFYDPLGHLPSIYLRKKKEKISEYENKNNCSV